MTATAVKGVGSILNSLTTNVSSQPAAGAQSVSFQSVWDSQAGKSDASQSSQPETKSAKDAPVNQGESLQSGNVRKAEPSQPEAKQAEPKGQALREKAPDEEIPEETLVQVMEVLGTTALDFMKQIADTLGLTGEQMQELLTQLDMKPVDLLVPEKLSAFLLTAGGAEDMLSLLTDEELYADFTSLMGDLQNLLQQDSGVDAMTLQEACELAQQSTAEDPAAVEDMDPKLPVEDAGPVIEVTVEKDADTARQTAAPRQEKSGEPAVQAPLDRTEEEDGSVPVQHTERRAFDRREPSEHGGQQAGNSFQPGQQVADTDFQTAQTSETAGHFDVDTQDIMRQIMDYMRIQVRADLSSLEMQLHPASLGTLQISVAAKGGVITANFVAQNEAVKAALESQMVQLKESFAEQGVKVEAIEVTVQTHEFEQNLEQGRERGQNPSAKGQRNRRLRFDTGLSEEELEALPQEELAAQRMAASGSTVEYTA